MHLNYAIVYVSDMSRSVAFYRDALGLPLRFESPEWSEFSSGQATLALHSSTEAAATAGGSGAPGQCHFGLTVDGLQAVHIRLLAAGAVCVQPPKDLHGTQMAQYRDPDGAAFSVSQTATRG